MVVVPVLLEGLEPDAVVVVPVLLEGLEPDAVVVVPVLLEGLEPDAVVVVPVLLEGLEPDAVVVVPVLLEVNADDVSTDFICTPQPIEALVRQLKKRGRMLRPGFRQQSDRDI